MRRGQVAENRAPDRGGERRDIKLNRMETPVGRYMTLLPERSGKKSPVTGKLLK